MKKITVTQPLAVQNRVLAVAKGKTEDQLKAMYKGVAGNAINSTNPKVLDNLAVWQAYEKGWRGNNVPNIAAVKSKYVPPAEARSAELLATAAKFAQKTTAAPVDTAAEDVMVCAKFLSLHSNAKARSKDFDLSIADVRKLLKTKRCAYTGEVLTKAKQSPPNNSDRTIDRLDSDKGYVKGNVFAVSHYANSLKNALFEKESEYKTTPEFIHAMTGKIIELGEK
tara:strand:- start:27372 stop:28043 length:672 start_codon:yes stop_codon:yes gene_type:complete